MKKLTAILSLSVLILISVSTVVLSAETNTTPAQKIQESQRAKRYSTEPPVHQYIAFLAFKKW